MRRIALVLAGIAATAAIVASARALLPPTSLLQPGVALTTPAARVEAGSESSPAPAPAAFRPGPNAARVALVAAPAEKLAQGYALRVHLSAPDGTPLNEAAVTYYEIVDLFGQREMLIGRTTTDGSGDGQLLYLPARLGEHRIVARAPGRGQVTPGEARITFDAQVAAAPYRTAPAPMAAFTDVLPMVVGGVVLAVWALIAFALLATARGVLGGARDHAHEKGDLA